MRKRRQPLGFSPASSTGETTPVFARIPAREAATLSRASFELKLPKQEILARLIARHLEQPAGVAEAPPPLEVEGDEIGVGRYSFLPGQLPEVLTLAQAAELLQVDPDVVRSLAEQRLLPGRLLGDEWRFSQKALLDWLSQPEPMVETARPARRT